MQYMVGVMDSTNRQGECRSYLAELSWLDACEGRQVHCWCETQASSDNAQSIIKNADNEASMHTTTPNWCAVLSCGVNQGKSRDVQCLGTCTPSSSGKSPQQRDSAGEFFVQSLEVVTESERSVQLYPKIHWDWTEWLISDELQLLMRLSYERMNGC